MTRLAKELRNTIKMETALAPEGEVPLEEMGEFFADGDRGDIRRPKMPRTTSQPFATSRQRRSRNEG
jgi:hypothetical protein